MKYVELRPTQIDGLKMLSDGQHKWFVLQRATLDNGDRIALIADKQENNNIRILWITENALQNKDAHDELPYIL